MDPEQLVRLKKYYDISSAVYWLPAATRACDEHGIPYPPYRMFKVDGVATDWVYAHEEELKQAARELGYPVFVRTDQISHKHDFIDSCYVTREEDLIPHIVSISLYGALALMPAQPTNAIIIRKYIEPDFKFRAFNGLPIAPERRYFVRDGQVVKHMPYWPEDAIRFYGHTKEPDGWREVLKEMNEETDEEIHLLTKYAEAIANEVAKDTAGIEQYWSIDFMKGRDGKWYFIDMAHGNVSWGGRDD